MKIGLQIKGYVDRSRQVLQTVDKVTRRFLYAFGLSTRKDIMDSIKPARYASPPGQPPRSKTGILKRGILFQVDQSTKSVATGAVALQMTRGQATQSLEHGGPVTTKSGYRYRMQPRPFAGPGFDKNQARVNEFWSNSIR